MGKHVDNLPNYSKNNELMNSISHLVGFVFSIVTIILFIIKQNRLGMNFSTMYPFYIYSTTMMIMFLVSTLYHASPLKSKTKAVFRLIDHSDIYLFVAGTYTPICLFGIQNFNIALALIIIEWSLALIGIILTNINLHNKAISIITYVIYLIGGWVIIFFYPFNLGINFLSFLFILIGGIVYTVGAIFYAIGNKKFIYLHSVFHVFVLLAAVLQFIGVWYLI